MSKVETVKIDRRDFIASLGGAAAVALMSHEAKADALEHHLEEKLYAQEGGAGPGGFGNAPFPSTAEVHENIVDILNPDTTARGLKRIVGEKSRLECIMELVSDDNEMILLNELFVRAYATA